MKNKQFDKKHGENTIYILFYSHTFNEGKVEKKNFTPLFISKEREKVMEKLQDLPKTNHYIIERFPINESLFELDDKNIPNMKLFQHEHFESDKEKELDIE